MPLTVSTVIPTFRRPAELQEALRSVVAQEGPLEVLVIDDSPGAEGAAAVESLGDARIAYLQMPEPTGGRPGEVRNLGFSKSSGDLLHFLDDDDVVPRGHYARARSEFERDPALGVLFGRVAPFGVDDQALAHEHSYFAAAARLAGLCRRVPSRLGFAACESFCDTMLVCSAGLARRRCVEAIGGFDPEVRMVEDVDYYARLFQRFPVRFIDEVSVHYRIGPSLMHSAQSKQRVVAAYRHMHSRYLRELGLPGYLALKTLARSLSWIP